MRYVNSLHVNFIENIRMAFYNRKSCMAKQATGVYKHISHCPAGLCKARWFYYSCHLLEKPWSCQYSGNSSALGSVRAIAHPSGKRFSDARASCPGRERRALMPNSGTARAVPGSWSVHSQAREPTEHGVSTHPLCRLLILEAAEAQSEVYMEALSPWMRRQQIGTRFFWGVHLRCPCELCVIVP